MLLINQTKDLILNLDMVTDLYIEKKTNSIKARVVGGEIPYHLGTYQSLEDCKIILNRVIEAKNGMNTYVYYMPLGGDVR